MCSQFLSPSFLNKLYKRWLPILRKSGVLRVVIVIDFSRLVDLGDIEAQSNQILKDSNLWSTVILCVGYGDGRETKWLIRNEGSPDHRASSMGLATTHLYFYYWVSKGRGLHCWIIEWSVGHTRPRDRFVSWWRSGVEPSWSRSGWLICNVELTKICCGFSRLIGFCKF